MIPVLAALLPLSAIYFFLLSRFLQFTIRARFCFDFVLASCLRSEVIGGNSGFRCPGTKQLRSSAVQEAYTQGRFDEWQVRHTKVIVS